MSAESGCSKAARLCFGGRREVGKQWANQSSTVSKALFILTQETIGQGTDIRSQPRSMGYQSG